jgi:hypothetical protein
MVALSGLAWLLAGSGTVAASQIKTLTYPEIVSRLYDLVHVAETPGKGERSGNWTSYGRAAQFDATSGEYRNWGSLDDGSGFLRKEGDDGIVAEVKGPGVIWRVWSAFPSQGHIKYFIDGAEAPVLDMPFEEYFNNAKKPFDYPELTGVLSRGYNSYVPIAFNKSIKIVLGKGWGAYYHFNYTLLSEGTSVPSFRGFFDDTERAALDTANRILSRRGDPAGADTGDELLTRDIRIPAGKTVRVADLRGARAITSIRVNPLDVEAAAGHSHDRSREIQILRQLVMQIVWDNESVPAVWSPLGDFFGSAPGVNRYRSIPMGMTSDHLYSSWYMPFSSRAVLELKNEGPSPRRIRITIAHRTEPRADRMLRFHAKWHRDDFGTHGADRYLKGDRWPDWPVLMADGGPGRFCGFHLHVWNPNPMGSKRKKIAEGWGDLNARQLDMLNTVGEDRLWWGEGDEKFFVDGERFPSTFGTGSEDYFGYAWAAFHPALFDSAFQALTLNNNNFGHISNVRFQIADNVPFQSSFEAVIEKYHPNAWPLLYAATVYWYQAPGTADTYRPVPLQQRLNYFVDVERDTDIYESEQLDVLRKDSGVVILDEWWKVFSADHVIVWKDISKAGDRLTLNLPVSEDGNYELLIRVGLNPDAGVYRMNLDGRAIGEALDLGYGMEPKMTGLPTGPMFFQHSQYAVELKEISLGRHDLRKGDHEIGIEALRPGGRAVVALDYVRLRAR